MQIDSADVYASVLVVPLDDLPLKESKRVLVQVGTTVRPSGWKTEPAIMAPQRGGYRLRANRSPGPGAVVDRQCPSERADRQRGTRQGRPPGRSGCPVRDAALDRDGAAAVAKVPAETMYLILSAN